MAGQPNDLATAEQTRRKQANVQRLRKVLGGVYVGLISYMGLVALFPWILGHAPSGLRWFGAPGSLPTLVVVLAFPAAILLLGRTAGRPVRAGTPLLILAAMAVSAAILGLASFWRCHGGQSPILTPLSWTLALFLGTVESVYSPDIDPGTYCGTQQFPVALELARLLAIGTTLSTALLAALTLFRSQLDRIAIRRARDLTVVVGLDDDTLPLVTAVARRMAPSQTLVVITSDAKRSCVSEVRQLGARIRELPLTDTQGLTDLRLWKHLKRLYLLSEDPVQNEYRLRAIDTAMDALGADEARLPLTVRIDDPWHAEVWRRSFLESRDPSVTTGSGTLRWVADAVGKYESTANRVARHLVRRNPARPSPDTVLLVGVHRLTYALTSELAQMQREQTVYDDPDRTLPSRVIVMAPDAAGFLDDHQLRQQRIAPGAMALAVESVNAVPSVEAVMELVGDEQQRFAVVLTDPSFEQYGTRLASRCTKLLIYQATRATSTLSNSSTVGRLYPFPIAMAVDEDAPQDAWERAAQLIHERYRANNKAHGWPIAEDVDHDWSSLPAVYQQQNRRQVTHTLALVESVGHSWNTLDHPPAAPLPDSFPDMDRAEKFRILNFTPETVEKMIAAEHESWRNLFLNHGWRYSERRDDKAKLHNRLLSWPELLEQDRETLRELEMLRGKGLPSPEKVEFHQTRAENSLIDTLLTLRSLGYRSIPKDTGDWRWFRRVGQVAAELRNYAWTWKTGAGDQMQAEAGDWAVIDDSGQERSVAPESFSASYELIEGNRYRRKGIFRARQVEVQETIGTDEGDAVAHIGDWIVEGVHGELWPVPADRFEATYEELTNAESSPQL